MWTAALAPGPYLDRQQVSVLDQGPNPVTDSAVVTYMEQTGALPALRITIKRYETRFPAIYSDVLNAFVIAANQG